MRAPRRPSAIFLALLLLAAAACGGDDVTVRGSLHEALTGGSASGWTVWAVEAEREAGVGDDGTWELSGMVPGPVTLEIRDDGKAVGRIELPNLAAGSTLSMEGLRVDRASGRAFPARVGLEGAKVVWINGVRMAEPGAVPRVVSAAGTVLAASDAGDVFLLRPADEALPDLRVVTTPETQWVDAAGGTARPGSLSGGDSARVEGQRDEDHVIASRVTVPGAAVAADLAPPLPGGGDDDEGEGGGGEPFNDGGEGEALGDDGGSAAAPVAAAPRIPVAEPRGRGRGRDDEPGRGRGNGRGKGKKERG